MLDFRQWWWERIRDDDVSANSSNKDISALVNILRAINEIKRLRLDLPVEKLAFSEASRTPASPFRTNGSRLSSSSPAPSMD